MLSTFDDPQSLPTFVTPSLRATSWKSWRTAPESLSAPNWAEILPPIFAGLQRKENVAWRDGDEIDHDGVRGDGGRASREKREGELTSTRELTGTTGGGRGRRGGAGRGKEEAAWESWRKGLIRVNEVEGTVEKAEKRRNGIRWNPNDSGHNATSWIHASGRTMKPWWEQRTTDGRPLTVSGGPDVEERGLLGDRTNETRAGINGVNNREESGEMASGKNNASRNQENVAKKETLETKEEKNVGIGRGGRGEARTGRRKRNGNFPEMIKTQSANVAPGKAILSLERLLPALTAGMDQWMGPLIRSWVGPLFADADTKLAALPSLLSANGLGAEIGREWNKFERDIGEAVELIVDCQFFRWAINFSNLWTLRFCCAPTLPSSSSSSSSSSAASRCAWLSPACRQQLCQVVRGAEAVISGFSSAPASRLPVALLQFLWTTIVQGGRDGGGRGGVYLPMDFTGPKIVFVKTPTEVT